MYTTNAVKLFDIAAKTWVLIFCYICSHLGDQNFTYQ